MDVFRSSVSGTCNGGGLSHLPQSPSTATCAAPPLSSTISTTSPPNITTTTTNTAANTHTHAHAYSNIMGGLRPHTSMHFTAGPFDVGPSEAARLEELRNILRLLDDVSRGRHHVVWAELVDPRQPVESARKITAALVQHPASSGVIEAIAACITTPAHLAIVAALEAPFRVQVRDAVLQELLTALTTSRNPGPMPVCSEMLAEMVRLNLVVLRGVATTLEKLLDSPDTRRAAIAVLGRLADQNRGDELFLQVVQNVEPLVRRIKEPEYDYDCITIARLLGWSTAERTGAGGTTTTAAAPSLVPVKTLEQSCAVTSMAYFRQRDELVSATCDGSVVIWGSPNPITGDVKPSVTIDLPQQCVPIAMDGPPRGNYLVIAGMPFPSGNLRAMMNEGINGSDNNNSSNNNNNNTTSNGSGSSKKRNILSSPAKGPVLRFLTCNESTGSWANGETITRKEHVTLTAVAALSNLVVCTAESIPSERLTESGLQHDLLLLNGHTAQPLRRFEHVHDDYTTVLRVGEEGEHVLLSGSRDCVVKVWDTRSSSSGGNRAALSTAVAAGTTTTTGGTAFTPTHRLKHTHTDTITAILPHRKALLTASLDGSLLMWDTRRMTAPVWETHMTAPIIDVAPAEGANIVVSTARGLTLLSLESHRAQDIISNVVHTQLRSNADGTVIFAAGGINNSSNSSSGAGGGVTVYAVRR
ncbi:uncharacterized protein TM35_000192010 [Trypanosoma theileri]|uniref:Uncharacterized protein n=1 Tax=Trypanosoma theileri TaxID=67003 RepID=A0A1X0NTB7_9TRYP|nr:uncharacterized protein TM35_000192010 [Trypanosoma theileri]ORC87957.1 hypothetical protein TM35_000192010 [Trypanosoma theileri]